MSEIIIRRRHDKSLAEARTAAEPMAGELQEEFDLDYAWDGNRMRFKRPGVTGELTLDEKEVSLSIRLGLLLFAVKPAIERAAHRYFDENFPV